METVEISSGVNAGVWYHIILGNPTDDWKQDAYIKMSASRTYMQGGDLQDKSTVNGTPRGTLSESGGMPSAFDQGGSNAVALMDAKKMDACALYAGNGCDPLGLYNSNNDGTANGLTDHRNSDWTGLDWTGLVMVRAIRPASSYARSITAIMPIKSFSRTLLIKSR